MAGTAKRRQRTVDIAGRHVAAGTHPGKSDRAGRTDTGVNARMMVAHFDLPEPLPEGGEDGYVRRLNAMTGRDIAVRSVRRVADNAHARFDATSRTYRYFAVTAKSPFLHRLAWQAAIQPGLRRNERGSGHDARQARLHIILQAAHRYCHQHM